MHQSIPKNTPVIPPFGWFTRWLLNTVGAGLVIYGAVHLAQMYHFFGRYESFVWFPAGVGLGIAYRFGRQTLPGMLIGLVAYYVVEDVLPAWAAVWTSCTWVISVLGFLYGMRAFGPANVWQAPLRGMIAFYVFGVVLAPAVDTLLDFPMMRLAGLIDPADDVRSYVFSYWLGEAYSVLVLAPAVYLIGRNFSSAYHGPAAVYAGNQRWEKLLWSALAGILLGVTFYFGQQHFFAGIQDVELVLYPMVAWSALRLGVVFTNLAVAVVTIAVFTFTAYGLGGTPSPQSLPTLVALSTFVLTIAIMAQMVAVQDLERRLRTARLTHAANHDWLTGLSNVRSFRDALADLIERSKSERRIFALGYIASAEHLALEQGYGVKARNEMLSELGEFLRFSLPSDVFLARISGGNFAALFPSCGVNDARRALEEVSRRMGAFQFRWGSDSYGVAPSYRTAPIDGSIDDPDRLLEWVGGPADDRERAGQVTVLASASRGPVVQRRQVRVRWLAEIQAALAEDRFTVVAQRIKPIRADTAFANTGERFEVLVRMRSPAGDLIMPSEFMAHAERYMLLPKIDLWVFNHTCAWFRSRPDCLARTTKMAFNLSGQSLSDGGFRETLRSTLDSLSIPAGKLCFEITETEAISNPEVAVGFFDQLRAGGSTVSLDDFGTGMSSYEYLKQFHCDFLKIDGIFVKNLRRGSTDYIIVQGMQNAAEAMGLETIAEYAESPEILECLRELGVHYAQGKAIGLPVPLADLFDAPRVEANRAGTA